MKNYQMINGRKMIEVFQYCTDKDMHGNYECHKFYSWSNAYNWAKAYNKNNSPCYDKLFYYRIKASFADEVYIKQLAALGCIILHENNN